MPSLYVGILLWQTKIDFIKNYTFALKVYIKILQIRQVRKSGQKKNIRLFGADVIRLMVIL
jgi:hypothetical protein